MNFEQKFLQLTDYTIPFGYEKELEPYLPDGWKKDSIGNYYYIIGHSETLFTAHLDTATDKREKINHIIDNNIIKTDGTTILGGDNKSGCCVLFYLIEQKIPGTYYFFLGEESAVHRNYPYGSLLAIEKNPELFKKFKRVISFDRKEKGQLITRQLGYNCCSDEFADALISEFSKNGLEYKKDRTGYYTDSAFFGALIPEITNLSAGTWNEHTKNEYVDIDYIEMVAKAASKVRWESLPVYREIDRHEIDPRSDVEIESITEDQKIFTEVFGVLDELYYVCQEVRSYTNFVKYFKPGRKYHFTEWHGDEKMDVSVEDGKIYINDEIYNNIIEFKKSLGIEKLNRKDFLTLMLDEFKKNDNRLSLAEFSYLIYSKGGNTKKISKDLKRVGWVLNKIGKGYQIVKDNKYIKTYESFKEESKHLKKFEELNFNNTLFSTSVNNLTNYYNCKECGQLFKEFNNQVKECTNCHSNNLIMIDIDMFYQKLKDKLGEEYHDKIQKVKSQEENEVADMTSLTRPVTESINDRGGLISNAKSFIRKLFYPLAIPIISNSSTEIKISACEQAIITDYIEEKAEYQILDEIKYDIEKPSELNLVMKRIKMISTKYKKYPDLDSYLNAVFNGLKILNILNFRNREDLDYSCDKIRDFFKFKRFKDPKNQDRRWLDKVEIGEKEWIEWAANNLYYDKGEIKRRKRIFYQNTNIDNVPKQVCDFILDRNFKKDSPNYDPETEYEEPDHEEPGYQIGAAPRRRGRLQIGRNAP